MSKEFEYVLCNYVRNIIRDGASFTYFFRFFKLNKS